ncbi:hypothetical protein WKI71_15310 [Streptomyces sp. MS1.AVA.1]|uniref:Integrin-like protein n=1 Tax=Streptomyces machairae TaxID=3134109 RepID=A0ABU8UK68_9ACTN
MSVYCQAGSAHAATPTVRQDFNGDGYDDLAVAAPNATVNGRAKAGYVAVLYGSANGLRTTAKKVYTQASAGIPGTVEAGDRFGSDLVTADLDGDGYSDLQVSADDERWEQGGIAREGSRTVLWGGPGGFTSGKVRPAVGDSPYQSGGGTVTGDFNGDGHADLLDNGRVEYGPFGRGGVPAGTTGAQLVDGDLDLVRVEAGDVDGDGITDLVTLARSFDADDEGNRGEHLNFLRGSRHGLGPLVVLRDAQGERIRPGHTLALGDVNGDRREDIVMGHGRLSFLFGTASGPADSVAPRSITQDTPGMPGTDEAGTCSATTSRSATSTATATATSWPATRTRTWARCNGRRLRRRTRWTGRADRGRRQTPRPEQRGRSRHRREGRPLRRARASRRFQRRRAGRARRGRGRGGRACRRRVGVPVRLGRCHREGFLRLRRRHPRHGRERRPAG